MLELVIAGMFFGTLVVVSIGVLISAYLEDNK